MNIDTILQHYMIAALWSSTGDDDTPLDDKYGISDISPETVAKMRADVETFVRENEALLVESGQSEEQIGHDFWLTRNGLGAGFWDRGLGEVGDKLSDACRAYPEVDLCVGDDGRIYA